MSHFRTFLSVLCSRVIVTHFLQKVHCLKKKDSLFCCLNKVDSFLLKNSVLFSFLFLLCFYHETLLSLTPAVFSIRRGACPALLPINHIF